MPNRLLSLRQLSKLLLSEIQNCRSPTLAAIALQCSLGGFPFKLTLAERKRIMEELSRDLRPTSVGG